MNTALPQLFHEYTPDELKPFGVLPDGEPYLLPPFGNYAEWKVAKKFRYVSVDGWLIIIPEDFLTDLASIPRWLRLVYGVNERETVAAVIHDYGYRNNKKQVVNILTGDLRCLTRKEWDGVFFAVMCLAKTRRVRRDTLYFGVRIGGWRNKNWRN